jgi:hypothetical protein
MGWLRPVSASESTVEVAQVGETPLRGVAADVDAEGAVDCPG